jgi:hypothetical protein
VNGAEDAVGANESPRVNGIAAITWVADQFLGIDGSQAAVCQRCPGRAAIQPRVWSRSMPSSYSVLVPVGGAPAVQGPGGTPLPVAIVADEVESIRHGRELAADSVPGKKESAIEHGDENAIEAPRNYNEFSVNGNNPLNSVSQSRGAPHPRLPPHPDRQWADSQNY